MTEIIENLRNKHFKQVEVLPSPQVAAEYIGQIWQRLQNNSLNQFIAAISLSKTTIPLYEWVIANSGQFSNWDKFQFLMMDEMMKGGKYVDETDRASYTRFAKEKFLIPLSSKVETQDFEPILPDIDDLGEIEKMLVDHNGIDLMVIAIGAGLHYAQVVPGTPADSNFFIADLTKIPGYKEVHTESSGAYAGAEFNDEGMSIGHQQLINAKNIILMITGESKAELLKILANLTGFDPEYPASVILIPEVAEKTTIVVSEEVINSL